VGTYSTAVNATSVTSCTVCSAATPYSITGATSCNSCASGCGSNFGRYACPGTDWTVWYDTTGVETANSCVKYYSDTKNWTQSRDACAATATGAHLLSSRQVCSERASAEGHLG
jgi:hypothetical protein